MDDYQHCLVERDGPVLTITINRPHVLNALHPPAHHELARAFDDFAADPDLRVAILTGTGERAFCVGTDIKARAELGRDDHPDSGFGGITMRFDLFKPVIAAVNGLALGGGLELVAACDLAVVADHVRLGLPEPLVGLAAMGGGGLQRLARQLPLKQAMGLVLSAKSIDAGEALRLGLVNQVVPARDLPAAARALAEDLLAGAPLALEAAKQVMLRSLAEPDLEKAMLATYPAAERMLASEDAKEGLRAFVEKRKPRWIGR
jgi:enoyl-CoA hydratase/carnithine racemase